MEKITIKSKIILFIIIISLLFFYMWQKLAFINKGVFLLLGLSLGYMFFQRFHNVLQIITILGLLTPEPAFFCTFGRLIKKIMQISRVFLWHIYEVKLTDFHDIRYNLSIIRTLNKTVGYISELIDDLQFFFYRKSGSLSEEILLLKSSLFLHTNTHIFLDSQ